MPGLRASVYVAPPIPFPLPKGRTGTWSPISSTLIIGEQEAVLVDTPITIAQNVDLANWVDGQLRPKVANAPIKKLTTLYITHGHFDHWAGIAFFQKRYRSLKIFATSGTIQHMKDAIEPKAFGYWNGLFPDQIDKQFVLADPLPGDGIFQLEGHELRAVEVGHSDTYNTTVLWVPSIKLAVCGDVVYGNVHQMLAAAKTKDLRAEWIRAIETVQSLAPELVVPGHKEAHEMDGVFHLENTRDYILQFGELTESGSCTSPKDLFAKMLEKYPTRFNEGALMAGCAAAFLSKAKM